MAISKRLRFEILRRDGHRCYYCHTDELPLTVDHVIPQALGGSDDPTNLAAACGDCNGGKASIVPGSETVADVDRRALLWSAAIKVLAQERQSRRDARDAEYARFAAEWFNWTCRDEPIYLPHGWQGSVDSWISAGLTLDDLIALVAVAMNSRASADDTWKYFCGCAWRTAREVQVEAFALAEQTAAAWNDESSMV